LLRSYIVLSSLSRNNKLIFWSLLAWGVGEGLWWYLLPIYVGSLGADSVQIGFVLSVAMILMTFSFIPSGWITDRVSRRLIMIIGWCAGLGAILLVASARTWQQVIPGLVLYNLSAFNMPAISSYVMSEIKNPQDIRRHYTLVFTGFTLGIMVSPPVGGWLADVWGLQLVFFLSAAIFAVSTILILLIGDQPIHRPAEDNPAPSLRSNSFFIRLCILFLFVFLVGHLGVPLAPNFLQDVYGLPLSWIGILGSANGLGAALLTLGLGRWPRSRTASLVLGEIAVAMYVALMLSTTAIPLLGLAFFLRGGLGAVRQLAAARLGEMMPAASMGLGYGIFQTVVNLAFTISPYVAGWLYEANPSYPFAASLILSLPVIAITAVVARQGPARATAR
jgi:MFS family permease